MSGLRDWPRFEDKALVVFEGQYHPKYALEACAALGLKDYRLAVVTADEEVWSQRLYGPRGQGYLVDDDMRNWADLLRNETTKLGGAVIDTSRSDLARNLEDFAAIITPLLASRS